MFYAIAGSAMLLGAIWLGMWAYWKTMRDHRKRSEEMLNSANAEMDRWREEWKQRYKL